MVSDCLNIGCTLAKHFCGAFPEVVDLRQTVDCRDDVPVQRKRAKALDCDTAADNQLYMKVISCISVASRSTVLTVAISRL